jgi:hypothetical protein
MTARRKDTFQRHYLAGLYQAVGLFHLLRQGRYESQLMDLSLVTDRLAQSTLWAALKRSSSESSSPISMSRKKTL